MTEIQEVLLNLVVELDAICRENDISFVLGGGNALGLERNGGFLPWDDDLDMFITASNLKKLDALLPTLDLPNRAWISNSTYPNYRNPIPRYADTTTTQLVRARLADGTPLAQMIEFFVVVPYPNTREEQHDFEKYLWLYHELEQDFFLVSFNHRAKDIVDEELYNEYRRRVDREGKDAVLSEIEREHLTYPEEECDYMCARYGGQNYVIKKEWMDNIVYRPFEGRMLPVFADNIEYLFFTEFGYNWNIVPAEGKEVTHNNTTNPRIPYAEHIDEVMRLYNQGNYRELQLENKRTKLLRRFRYLDLQERVALQKHAYLTCLVESLQEREWVFEYEQLDNYSERFAPFFSTQFNKQYSKWRHRVDMRDDLLQTMLLTLIYRDRIEDAEGLLGLYEDYSEFEFYEDAIQSIYRLKVCKYSKKIEEVGSLLDRLESELGLGGQIEVERTKVWYAVQTDSGLDEDGMRRILLALNRPEDAEVKKYVGDFYLRQGNRHKASLLYAPAQKSRNGMLLYDMNEKGFYC